MGKIRKVLLVVILFTALALPAAETGAQQRAPVGDGPTLLAGKTWEGQWQANHRGEARLQILRHEGSIVEAEFYIISFTRKESGVDPFEETFTLEGTYRKGRLFMTGRSTKEGRTYAEDKILDMQLQGEDLVGRYRGTGWINMTLKPAQP